MRLKRQKLPFPSSGCAGGAHNKEKEKEMEKEKEKGSSGPLPAGAAAAVGYMSVEDADALDCGACYHPLKPPIFQCNEGHVVCSSCRDKLVPAGKCHVCGTATSNYHRCHAMERLVDSIRVPCPNAAYGCNTRPAYYDHHGHCKTCPYAPYHCPSKECSFFGSTDALLDHLTGAHGWPSPTNISVFEMHSICLYDGFNFLLADCAEDDNHGNTTTTISSNKYLFLLNVTRQSLGRAISVHLIGQGSPSEILRCVLSCSLVVYDRCERHKFLASHSLESEINVECMDLPNGPTDPADCSHFVVPHSVLGDKNKEDPIQVNVCISIINLQ
ncbi:putative E3 ubiquitin-protein ligase SINA-like 6 [Sorghum bicolor]|uniref:RING-type E3 ubiquitin transferase n=1 Tax=Sorghum bicolor TaxID=4558 RepID=C5Z065_SORBI|nr:putative E3 ubiquitin-protein ligase SINA-like 6 [Sorghum bicolor]EES17728.1 hypothetical protein SORBI_3009G047000 [Sorghum bicolor]|eukprot:XP_002439298.1 putative E3 ubiquitin-protein ligase SINA-like 6 [Sorghum bicolor]